MQYHNGSEGCGTIEYGVMKTKIEMCGDENVGDGGAG